MLASACAETSNWQDLRTNATAAQQQAPILADAGADLFILEMMIDIDKMLVLLDAARSTGLPVWVGFTCHRDEAGGVRLRNGEPLAEAIAAIPDKSVDLVCIMHTEIEVIDASIDALQAQWSGPIGVYAHSGRFNGDYMDFNSTISPEVYSDHALRWIEQGVQVIGGCCGIEPRHIEHLAGKLRDTA